MNKLLSIIGLLLIVFGLALYGADFLPVDFFSAQPAESEHNYYKVVEADGVQWSNYRGSALIMGLILLLISRMKNNKL